MAISTHRDALGHRCRCAKRAGHQCVHLGQVLAPTRRNPASAYSPKAAKPKAGKAKAKSNPGSSSRADDWAFLGLAAAGTLAAANYQRGQQTKAQPPATSPAQTFDQHWAQVMAGGAPVAPTERTKPAASGTGL
ncbi:MAG: hypothetical protein ACYDAG_08405 [Chloroflexota bacterium]